MLETSVANLILDIHQDIDSDSAHTVFKSVEHPLIILEVIGHDV